MSGPNGATVRVGLYGMMISVTFLKAVGITASIMARESGRSFWAAEVAAVGAAILLTGLVALIAAQLPDSLHKVWSRVFPPWVSRPLDFLEFSFFACSYLGGMYAFLGHTQYFFLPETPLVAFLILNAFVTWAGAVCGLTVLLRAAVVSAVGYIMLTVLMLPGTIWDVRMLNLWPIGAEGWQAFSVAGLTGLADLVQPIPLLLMLLPRWGRARGAIRHAMGAAAASGLIVLTWPLVEATVLGPGLTAQQQVACMAISRAASLGPYLHRYELIMLVFAIPGIFLNEGLPFLGAADALGRALGLSASRPLLIPLAAGFSVVSLTLFVSPLRVDWFFTTVWPWAVLGLCSLLLLAGAVTAVLAASRRLSA